MRSRLTNKHLNDILKVTASQDMTPGVDALVQAKRCQVSGTNTSPDQTNTFKMLPQILFALKEYSSVKMNPYCGDLKNVHFNVSQQLQNKSCVMEFYCSYNSINFQYVLYVYVCFMYEVYRFTGQANTFFITHLKSLSLVCKVYAGITFRFYMRMCKWFKNSFL